MDVAVLTLVTGGACCLDVAILTPLAGEVYCVDVGIPFTLVTTVADGPCCPVATLGAAALTVGA